MKVMLACALGVEEELVGQAMVAHGRVPVIASLAARVEVL
jgi:hypothetical protein